MNKKYLIIGITMGLLFSCVSKLPVNKPKYIPPTINESIAIPKSDTTIKEIDNTMISQNEFYNSIGITVDNKDKKQFIIGDNIAGYYEGYTNSYTKGAGYLMGNKVIFKNFGSFNSGKLLYRKKDTITQNVMPYGTVINLNGGFTEELAIHSKNHSLSMRVTSKNDTKLGIAPMLQGSVKNWDFIATDKYFALSPKNGGKDRDTDFMVFIANQPFNVDMNNGKNPEIETLLKLKETSFRALFSGINPTKDFILYMAFGSTLEEAKEKAALLQKSDGHQLEKNKIYNLLTKSLLWTNDDEYNQALTWAKYSAYTMVVEEFGKGIWAGLPWFKDNWGRDTFIALPGTLLVSGNFEEAKEVINNFATFQNLEEGEDYGRVPNRVTSLDNMIYNTTDGTPWLIREIYEYIQYSGDTEYGKEIFPVVKRAIEGAIENFVDDDGFMNHDAADTWMDARINNKEPWSDRGSKAVEIQALWFSMLESGVYLADKNGETELNKKWDKLAQKLKTNFYNKFWDKENKIIADRIREDGSPDQRVRPNQLMVISIPLKNELLNLDSEAMIVKNTTTDLLYPYGITSLSEDDPYFHPFHENPKYYHKDAAYHNGTIWGWNAGLIVTGLNKFGYQDLAYKLTKNLSNQILTMGAIGSMSENLSAFPDKNGDPILSGTFSQAWSVSEFARNGYQDYLGFRPSLLENSLKISPSFPTSWNKIKAELPFGDSESITIVGNKNNNIWEFSILLNSSTSRDINWSGIDNLGVRREYTFKTEPYSTQMLIWNTAESTLKLNGTPIKGNIVMNSFKEEIGDLNFRTPNVNKSFPSTSNRDVLKGIILNKEYK